MDKKQITPDLTLYSDGRLFSKVKNKFLPQYRLKKGYVRYSLGNNSKFNLVHRMVAEAFIPNPENKKCVNHKNCIKDDNRVDNLEWATYSENTKHAYDKGRFKYKNSVMPKGTSHANSKLNDLFIRIIREALKNKMPHKDIANYFNVTVHNISAISQGKTWKHVI